MTEIVNITDRERAKDRLIAQLSAGRDALAVRLDKVLSDLLELKRSNEALELDAARYRFLESDFSPMGLNIDGNHACLPLVQATAPREIWLHVSDEAEHSAEPFPDDAEVSWCADSMLACEVRYVRDDLAQVQPTLSVAKSIAAEQADDPSLWFVATTATEAHLQHALRHLAAAVEGTLVSTP